MLAIWIETKTWNVPTWLHTWWQHSLTPISKEILASYDVVLYKNGKSAPLSRTMMAIWPEKKLGMVARLVATQPHSDVGRNR